MTDKSKPAFPGSLAAGPSGDIYTSYHENCEGMTLREYAAIKAMQGILAGECEFKTDPILSQTSILQSVAQDAVQMADILLAELDKEQS